MSGKRKEMELWSQTLYLLPFRNSDPSPKSKKNLRIPKILNTSFSMTS